MNFRKQAEELWNKLVEDRKRIRESPVIPNEDLDCYNLLEKLKQKIEEAKND